MPKLYFEDVPMGGPTEADLEVFQNGEGAVLYSNRSEQYTLYKGNI